MQHARTVAAGRQDLDLARYPVLPLMRRAFDLRANVTAYDATSIALAEQLDCALLTADRRLAAAPTIRCPVDVLERRGQPAP